MPTGSQDKLARCRDVRRIHLNSNVPVCSWQYHKSDNNRSRHIRRLFLQLNIAFLQLSAKQM